MMIQAIRLTRKKAALAVILAGAVLAALILLLGQHGGNVGASEQPCLSSNGERVAYLRELGWEIDSEPLTTLQFLLPPKLSACSTCSRNAGWPLVKTVHLPFSEAG